MNRITNPNIEFNWTPTLLAAGTVVVVGFIANFVVMRPNLIGWSGVFAGIVASAASGYYDPSGNNAAIGTLLGFILLTPVLVYTRAVFVFGIQNTGDIAFAAFALAGGWLVIAAMVLIPVGYISASLTDMTRKKVGGPIGY